MTKNLPAGDNRRKVFRWIEEHELFVLLVLQVV